MNQSINTDSKNSKEPQQKYRLGTVVLKIVDFLTINYDIVLSSVLFGYGTFICINTIDIILLFYIYTNEV